VRRLIPALVLVILPVVSPAQVSPGAPVVALVPPPPPPPPPDPRVAFTGTFDFAGGARERAALDAALEHTVQGLFFAIRPIARPRLHALNPAYPSVTIRFVNGNIEMNLPGAPFFRSPESGVAVAWTAENGNPAHLSQRFDGARIVQNIVASNGSRRNTYTLSPDGHTLTMNVYITAGQLPGPLVYTLTYRR
jgi:hypothetical protein